MDGQGTGIEYRIGRKDRWTKKKGSGREKRRGDKKREWEEKQEGYRSNYGLLSLLLCPDPRQEQLPGAGRAETTAQAAAPAGVNGRFPAVKLGANEGKGREAAAEDAASEHILAVAHVTTEVHHPPVPGEPPGTLQLIGYKFNVNVIYIQTEESGSCCY